MQGTEWHNSAATKLRHVKTGEQERDLVASNQRQCKSVQVKEGTGLKWLWARTLATVQKS